MALFLHTPGNYFVAHNATLTGQLTIGALSSFWFNTVVRGDVAPISIGSRVNVQDQAVIHCDTAEPQVIEDDVVIGHRAILHGQFIGSGSLIGMGAILLGGTRVGRDCIIAAGAVLAPGTVVPDGTVVMGLPAKVARPVTAEEQKNTHRLIEEYIELARRYVNGSY